MEKIMSKRLVFFIIWGVLALPGVIGIWLGMDESMLERFFSASVFGFLMFFGLGSIWLARNKVKRLHPMAKGQKPTA